MKVLKNVLLVSVFIVCSKTYGGGTDVFYGGDNIVTQFQQIQDEIYNKLRKVPDELLPIKNFLPSYEKARLNLKIEIKKQLLKNDQEVAFLNYPYENPKRVEISRSLWKCDNFTMEHCQRIVLHEMIHLMQYDDSNYQYSSSIARAINFFNKQKTLNEWAQPLLTNNKDLEFNYSYWIFTNINNYQNIPEHPFYWNFKINEDSISFFKNLLLQINEVSSKKDEFLLQQLQTFINLHDIKPIDAGLFIIGINIYYSNGTSYCLFPDMKLYKKRTGKWDIEGIKRYYSIPSVMLDDGYCQ